MTTLQITPFHARIEIQQLRAPSKFEDVEVVGITMTEGGHEQFIVLRRNGDAVWPGRVDCVSVDEE